MNMDTDTATGAPISSTCASSPSNNSGCAFSDENPCSYGHEFNMIAGGAFAHLWNHDGIKMWHFPRTGMPADITAQQPNPDSWGPPAASYTIADGYTMNGTFYDHQLVIDTTLCGDWAGATYTSAGCPGTCADRVANPSNFKCKPYVHIVVITS